jgi:hypothetical protein
VKYRAGLFESQAIVIRSGRRTGSVTGCMYVW